MKTLCVSVLAVVIPLVGGCTEQRPSDTVTEGWWRDERREPGPPGCPPTTIVRIHVPDSVHPTLLAVKRTLQEIDVKMKNVKKALDVASKKAPTSGESDIERALGEIDLKIREVRTALDIASRRVPISGDAVQIIAYLRPKLNVQLHPDVLYSDNRMRMSFNIKNRGEHSVSVEDLQLVLATECIRDKHAAAGRLLPDVDYTLEWEFGSLCAAPGQTIKCVADIEMLQAELERRPLYYGLCIDAETEPEIAEVLSVLLFDSLETDRLYTISRASFTFAGEISPFASSYPD